MAIAFRSATTQAIAATASPQVSAPAGLTDGDLIIVALFTGTTANVNDDQSGAGWTSLTWQDQGSDGTLFILYKIASSEGASWTFTNYYDGIEGSVGFALAYSGVDNTTPLDVAHITGDLGTISSATDTAAITPTNTNSMIVSVFGADPSSDLSSTPDASPPCTERVDFNDHAGASYGWLYAQEHVQTTAQAEAHTITPSAEDGICYKVLALRAAAAAGGTPSPRTNIQGPLIGPLGGPIG